MNHYVVNISLKKVKRNGKSLLLYKNNIWNLQGCNPAFFLKTFTTTSEQVKFIQIPLVVVFDLILVNRSNAFGSYYLEIDVYS